MTIINESRKCSRKGRFHPENNWSSTSSLQLYLVMRFYLIKLSKVGLFRPIIRTPSSIQRNEFHRISQSGHYSSRCNIQCCSVLPFLQACCYRISEAQNYQEQAPRIATKSPMIDGAAFFCFLLRKDLLDLLVCSLFKFAKCAQT